MAKKLEPIYEMQFGYPCLELSYAYYEDQKKYCKDEKLIEQIGDFSKHAPLSKDWKSVSVAKEGNNKSDFVNIDLKFGVSEKAKKLLEKEYGKILEFLPLEVVGKIVEVGDFDTAIKPVNKKQTFYLMNPITKMKVGKGSRFEKFPACRDYRFLELDEEEVKKTPIFRPQHSMKIFATQQFKKFVEQKKLKGLEFQRQYQMDWKAIANEKSSKAKSPVIKKSKAKSTVPSKAKSTLKEIPAPTSTKTLISKVHLKMTKSLWKAMAEHWKWSCDVAQTHGDSPLKPKVSKPITKSQLEKLRRQVGFKLPAEFEHVLLNFSRKVEFSWSLFEASQHVFDGGGEQVAGLDVPAALDSCTMGGEKLWDINDLANHVAMAKKFESSWLALRERLPFMSVGNGDLIAFDMRERKRNSPIVFLCHDDRRYDDKKIGDNFVDFLANWSSVGCAGPDFDRFEPFYNKRDRKISGKGKNAKRWRTFMENGN